MLGRLSILLVALALAAVSGCGGGDDSASEDAATTEAVAEDTTTEETTTEATETGASDGDTGTFAWASEDCQSLIQAYAGLSAAVGAASGGQEASGEIEEFSQFADKVPDEIQADVESLAEAYRTFLEELEDIDVTPGETPSDDAIQALAAASAKLGSAGVQAASERLNAWMTEKCSS